MVEDNATMRTALKETLKVLGYRTLEASHGREALEMIEKSEMISPREHDERIDLVISDMSMPVMDGQELLRELRKRGNTLPVVLLTGLLSNRELEMLREDGLSGWLIKPAGIDQISELLEKLIVER